MLRRASAAAVALTREHGGRVCENVNELLALSPDVVIVAVPHDELADLAESALGPEPMFCWRNLLASGPSRLIGWRRPRPVPVGG